MIGESSFARRALTHCALILVTMAVLYPLVLVLKIAFGPGQGFSAGLSPIPDSVSLENFRAVIGETTPDGVWLFGRQLLNSAVIAISTTIVGILLACTDGYAFSRFDFPGRETGLMTFLVSQMFPGVMMMIPLYLILEKLGLLNAPMGLILVYATTSIPFCVWMLKGYFDTIPRELEESAIMDGASRFTIFWRIILPLSAPAVAVTALFSFMTAWNEFILASVFMSEAGNFTLPVKINSYVNNEDIKWGLFAASSILVSVPVMALFYGLQKYLVGGLTAGAVKG